jgi:hypothetical protein
MRCELSSNLRGRDDAARPRDILKEARLVASSN